MQHLCTSVLLKACSPEVVQALAQAQLHRYNEGSLAHWILKEGCCKEVAPDHWHVLARALESLRTPRALHVSSCNVTKWAGGVRRWTQVQGHAICVQEHHLLASGITSETNALAKLGVDFFAMEAFRASKGTSGGVAILLRKSIGGRLVHYRSEQGCVS